MSPKSQQNLAWLVADRYSKGDHLVDGGPEVGLFWASNISALGTHEVRPISEGLSILSNAMKDPVYSKGLRYNLSQYF
jgi:hypothetical protein|tara:strand:+ start:853 stop:1086 length:234 start_codon:yes stop_codon:yes gene_type:complete